MNWPDDQDIHSKLAYGRIHATHSFFIQMFLIAAWEIWNTRNNWIFDNGRVSICLWIVKFKEQVLLQLLRVKDVYQPQIVQWLDTIVLESWVFSFASFVPPSSVVSISVSFLPCTILLFYKWKWSVVENFYLFINENEALWGTPPQFFLKKVCLLVLDRLKAYHLLTHPPPEYHTSSVHFSSTIFAGHPYLMVPSIRSSSTIQAAFTVINTHCGIMHASMRQPK